jgi:ABC-type multidrug transport system fused ATPase/permease subunit
MKRQLDNYNNMQTKINDTYLCINNTRKEYAAACKLYTSLLESESVVITNLIQNINDHARIYLEHFFVNDLMSAELMTFKSNKKNVKPQINIQIHHKGMESDINMLSGGELSRVVLAFTLALAEIFNTPLLLLDECTSSLDQELANDVFEVIKENFKGKTVIIVAHQVVTGIFDKIITI